MKFNWGKKLANFPLINQVNGDLNQYNDCGPTSMAMIILWATGVRRDPFSLLAADPDYGPNYTGDVGWNFLEWDCGQHGWGYRWFTCTSKSDMITQLNTDLNRGHPTVCLMYINIDGQWYPHFEVVVETWYAMKTFTRYYRLANPWGGVFTDLSAAELWSVAENQFLSVHAHAPVAQKQKKAA